MGRDGLRIWCEGVAAIEAIAQPASFTASWATPRGARWMEACRLHSVEACDSSPKLERCLSTVPRVLEGGNRGIRRDGQHRRPRNLLFNDDLLKGPANAAHNLRAETGARLARNLSM